MWAQVAAALLVLGLSAGAANLDVHYGSDGLSVRTGWMKPAPVAAVAPVAVSTSVTRGELLALEQQLRADMHAAQPASAAQPRVVGDRGAGAPGVMDDGKTRALIAESERRQKAELTQRLAQLATAVEAERQGDLAAIDGNLRVLRNGTLTVDSQQRQLANYVTQRVSLQK